ncbi:MAG: GyrI-like domain-containing protein [Eubacteriales bacterium]
MATFDFKKAQKDLYAPKTLPSVVDVPNMRFIMVDGKGNPNTSKAYASAIEILYGLSYGIRMNKPEAGYFAYVVPPLEGLWRLEDGGEFKGNGAIEDKDQFVWTAMIRQPDFVTDEVFEKAKQTLAKKKPYLDLSLARLEDFTEGLCVQVMHIGPYDDEPATIANMEDYTKQAGYVNDIHGARRHHEIYLSDPRKSAPEKMKTIIRHPIRRADPKV